MTTFKTLLYLGFSANLEYYYLFYMVKRLRKINEKIRCQALREFTKEVISKGK